MKTISLPLERFWNPLILPARFNDFTPEPLYDMETYGKFDDDGRYANDNKWRQAMIDARKTFFEKLPLAQKTLRCKQWIVPQLDFPQANSPEHGLTVSGEFIPSLFWGGKDEKEMEKAFRYWWPRSANGKPMRWVMTLDVGPWVALFHKLTGKKQKYNGFTSAYGCSFSPHDDRGFHVWYHVFVEVQNSFDSATPDCAIIPQVQAYYDKEVLALPKDVAGLYGDLFRQHQANADYNPEVSFNPPCDYLGAPILRFQKDKPAADFDAMGDEASAEETTGEVQMFGVPTSQQVAKRYISPNRYVLGATVPLIGCHDSEHDMNHQFYADTQVFSPFSHKRMYCKMDSSCT